MNLTKKILGLSLVAAMSVSSMYADDSGGGKKSLENRIQELEAKLKDTGYTGVKGSGIKISGYVDTSYTVNLADKDNSGPSAGGSQVVSGVAGTTTGPGNTGRVFDRQFDSFNLNAVKLTIEKDKDTSKFPAGFRVDTIYGNDATVINGSNNQGAAANDSEFAVEQAYITLGVPIGNGVDVKFGKMVTLLGYEVIESPANWQFSRSDAFRLAPMTQTGVTLGYKWNDYLTSTVGVINGWDSTSGTGNATAANTIIGSGNRDQNLSFIGRLDASAPKTSIGEFNAFVASLYGNDIVSPSTVVAGTGVPAATTFSTGEQFIWNIGGTWNKPFEVKEMALGIDYLYRSETANLQGYAGTPAATSFANIDASALSAYGKWDWNKWLTSSGRFSYSWYKNANVSSGVGGAVTQESLGPLAVPSVAGVNGFIPQKTDNFSFTLTQAFNVWKDTLIRLEWRRDWTTAGAVGFGSAGTSATGIAGSDIRQTQDTVAVNLVYSF